MASIYGEGSTHFNPRFHETVSRPAFRRGMVAYRPRLLSLPEIGYHALEPIKHEYQLS
jgi:hypothetical protein